MRITTGLLAAVVACGPKPPPDSTIAAPEAASPRLVVLVVVDQLPTRLMDAALPHVEGGLKRLTGPDAYVGVGRYSHAITFTCPGHATISTGAEPAVHGIASNDWLVNGEGTYCAKDGKIDFLRAEPVADQVRENGGLVVATSLKDRGAIMLGGHDPTLVSWYDKTAGFVGPDWVRDAAKLPERGGVWEPLREDVYKQVIGADRGPFEPDLFGDPEFPHVPTAKTFLYTPAAGSALTDVAIAAVTTLNLGDDDVPDLLTVSYSQTDYIGHAFSAESWEALDAMLRLDADLERLFAHLDAEVGAGRYTVVLTSDHGAGTPGEVWVDTDDLVAAADRVLTELKLPTGAKWEDPGIWLPDAVRNDPEARKVAAPAVAKAVAAVPGIGGAWAWRDGELPDDLHHAQAVRDSLDAERSGDVYVMLASGALYIYDQAPRTGTSHGTAFDYDQRVPLLLVGAGVKPGKATADADQRQVASTVAALAGVAAPAQAKHPPVAEALK